MITIRERIPADNPQLVAIWQRSVRATHHFIGEKQMAEFKPLVEHYLPLLGVWVAESAGRPNGFIALDDNKVEMLFIDAGQRGQGVGSALLNHAQARHDGLVLDVNEQNPQAVGFYQRYGFVVTGRSPLDGQGNPYPLLHMALSPR
ncbi:acetyltransferase [Serratia sp. MYb239]|uniref:acetyltransferase n=1 Tax=unclassified Serratia (in: enterobacteria) TaxID=2647522 RepID=UPI000CF6CAE6|nr:MULTISPECIES: acetyltransferase [unclassified Serratia (in: enterobacteria)]AVJ16791.1 acetyltransferase [Serratia sp. MYb239]CAE1143851.1 Peptidyl-lysine N-acetyltransferase YjaB [Serratia sp. Tan611]